VIELLLKARLVRLYASVSRGRRDQMAAADRRIRDLLYSHDLHAILNRVPGLEEMVVKRGERDGRPYRTFLRAICTTWNIYARYSTQTSTIGEAKEWLDRIRELKEVLK
jgi:hypothetical protein